MISDVQMMRTEREFASAADDALESARRAELQLQDYQCGIRKKVYDPQEAERLVEAYNFADYTAESRAWILDLIRGAIAKLNRQTTNGEQTHE